MSQNTIRFVLDGKVHAVGDIDPTTTVLDYLREDLGRTGTKEGCAEGDCGACTVVIAELDDDGQLRYRNINSCIRFLPTIDGKELITVESLKNAQGELHPVQQAMVDCHGSQCGFCTPGFVMTLFNRYMNSDETPNRHDVDTLLAGNLCRCTGYRPIIDAASQMYAYDANQARWRRDDAQNAERIARLKGIQRRETLELAAQGRYSAPTGADEFARIYEAHPDAQILAGATDIGLWVTKQFRELPTLLYLGDVAEFRRVSVGERFIEIGAAVTLTDAYETIVAEYPEFTDLYERFASPPVRNSGTLVGNVANASPIGDTPPALIALGSTIVLRKGDARRELAMEDFFLAYQKTDRAPGEFLEAVRIPRRDAARRVALYKISKRFDSDISAVCAGIAVELKDGAVADVRLAYGGMAATPKRAAHAEAALRGQPWTEATIRAAMVALAQDYTPISDMRASAGYRLQVAQNLLMRFFLESEGVATRVSESVEA